MNTHDTRPGADTPARRDVSSPGSAVSVFTFEGHKLRATMVDGDPRFLAADAAATLGYSRTAHAMRILDPDMKGVQIMDTPGGKQQVSVITEGGYWRLITRSQRPEAKRVERWMVDEVMPTLRRTGRYEMPGAASQVLDIATLERALSDTPTALLLLSETSKRLALTMSENIKLSADLAEMEPAAKAWHGLVVGDTEGMPMRAASKVLRGAGARIGDQEFPSFLASKGLIYRALGSGRWLVYKTTEESGLLTMAMSGGGHPVVRVLARGMEHLLAVLIAERGSAKPGRGQMSMELVIR